MLYYKFSLPRPVFLVLFLLFTMPARLVHGRAPQVPDGGTDYTTSDGTRFSVQVVVTGLKIPWSLAFEGDDLYFTERGGKLWCLKKGAKEPILVAELNEVHSSGEGGLMGLA